MLSFTALDSGAIKETRVDTDDDAYDKGDEADDVEENDSMSEMEKRDERRSRRFIDHTSGSNECQSRKVRIVQTLNVNSALLLMPLPSIAQVLHFLCHQSPLSLLRKSNFGTTPIDTVSYTEAPRSTKLKKVRVQCTLSFASIQSSTMSILTDQTSK